MNIKAIRIEGNGTFAQDVPALAEAIKASGADLVLFPGNSRVKRSAPAAALRAGAEIDTNVVDVEIVAEKAVARRWVYRQRIYTTFNDMRRPVQRVVIHFQLRSIHSLQHHVGTALQIQSLFNRTGQRPDVHNKPAHNGQRHNQELP